MDPRQPASLLHLAASLGSEAARAQLSGVERQSLDDAFDRFMSTSDFLPDGIRYGEPRQWPYSHEAALRIGIAAFQEFIPDWQATFRDQREKIPDNVAPDFPQVVIGAIEGWLQNPRSFDWDEHTKLYCFIKDDTCLDGYLPNDFPQVPKVISAWCLGSLMLIDSSNWQHPFQRSHVIGEECEFDPQGVYSANVPDGIAFLLEIEHDDKRIRRAVKREVIPWCLAQSGHQI